MKLRKILSGVIILLMLSMSAMAQTDSSLGNEQESETAIEFDPVLRFMEWDYHSTKRRYYDSWSTGVRMLGSFHESEDGVLLWQLRGFKDKYSSYRANPGLIYRWAHADTAMFGVNTFLDYVDHDLGDFARWSFGGEIRTEWVDFYGNRYLAITDPRYDGDGRYTYVQDGLEIGAKFYMPNLSWIYGSVDYYLWEGEFWDSDDELLFYGIGMNRKIAENVLLNLYLSRRSNSYGDGTSLGGSVSYAYRLKDPQNAICLRLNGKTTEGNSSYGWTISYVYEFETSQTRRCAEERPHSFNPRNDFFLTAPREEE